MEKGITSLSGLQEDREVLNSNATDAADVSGSGFKF
jgi:hypothetical protein